MGYLIGLNEYLAAHYHHSLFDQAILNGQPWMIHAHPRRMLKATILEAVAYDIAVAPAEGGREVLPKIQIKFLYPAYVADSVQSLLQLDRTVEALNLGPHFSPRCRHHVKNKTLFPLMEERTDLIFTTLEGDLLKGIITGFNRYEITLYLKEELPVTLLRHAIQDIRDNRGTCYLKTAQERCEDWKKSSLYVDERA
ncbi:MAG: hypothetical protein P8Y00_06420 [Deltaproteobacteria bacterium]